MRSKLKILLLTVTILTLVAQMSFPAFAQNPTGSIRGTITDQQGDVIPNASITVTNKATGEVRKSNTGNDGIYQVSTLLPGEYEIKVEAGGFATQISTVLVQVGNTSSGDASLRVGTANEIVDVVAEAPIIDKQNFKIDGVINRQKVEALPLNGRNFLQLALLEPGVSVSAKNPGSQNNLFNVSIGGADSALTRLTVDGGSIVDPVCGGAAQNFSTETIQEFQIQTFNFDLSTGTTSVGAINIVSRTGTNDYHGSGFLYFRDHSIAANPNLQRSITNPDPYFRRYQYGGAFGGPIKKDKAFFFANAERLDQTSAISNVVTGFSGFSQFNTTFTSPYKGFLVNVRGDYSINDKNKLFSRYSYDHNDTLAPDANNSLPSRWRDNKSRDHNLQFGLTTIFTNNLVNDARFNYQKIKNVEGIPSSSQCPASEIGCIGLGGAQVQVNNSNLLLGNTTNAPQARDLDRYQTTDSLSWQKGAHRIRIGGEWEHNYGKGLWAFLDPALIVLHDPRDVIATNAFISTLPLPAPLKAALTIPLPAAFTTPGATLTLDDILQLPIIAGAVGIGDPSQPPPFNTEIARQGNRYRFFAQDSWLVRPGFTFSFGAAYQYETNLANHDLAKPALIAPLIGDIGKPGKDKNNIAPSIGFAWDVANQGKTVIRGGAGIYYDTVLFVTRLQERATNGPAGNGRSVVATAYFQNNLAFPQLPLPAPLNLINPALGTPIDFRTIPTKFTGANFLTLLNAQGPIIAAGLQAAGAAGFSGLDFFKTGDGILDPNLESPYSEQFTIGVQRQLPRNMALSADFVLRKRVHTLFANDFNVYNRPDAFGGPAIRRCVGLEAVNPSVQCSNGSINVTQSSGRSDYRALLVKLDKRFSNRYQFTASYSLASRTEFFTGENLLDWFGNKGPAGSRHNLTISGVVDLPLGFQASLIAVYGSRGAFNARLGGTVDINGDGTGGDTLPGLEINTLGRGTSKQELITIVNQFNSNFAGKQDARGATINPINLPTQFEFGDDFQSEDIRLSKTFTFKESYKAQLFAEVFNLFNIANLTGYSQTLNSNFGQPTQRAGQAFGTGGPRAFQFGGRFTF